MKRGYEMARQRLGYALPDTGAAAAEGFQALGRREFADAAAAFARRARSRETYLSCGYWKVWPWSVAETWKERGKRWIAPWSSTPVLWRPG